MTRHLGATVAQAQDHSPCRLAHSPLCAASPGSPEHRLAQPASQAYDQVRASHRQQVHRHASPPPPAPLPPKSHELPTLPLDILPIRAVTWNSSCLLGTLHMDYSRRQAKRSAVEELCRRHDVVCIQETRGAVGDLLMLPADFEWHGTFSPLDDASMGSRAGGTVVGRRRAFRERFDDRWIIEVVRGRSIALELALSSRPALQVVSVHTPPHSCGFGIRWFFAALRNALRLSTPRPTPTLLLGDWNFTSEQADRMRTTVGDMHLPAAASEAFHSVFQECHELHQPLFTFSRRDGDAAQRIFSRLDRIYTNVPEMDLLRMHVAVGAPHGFHMHPRPSDHLPVSLTVMAAPRSRLGRRRIPSSAAGSPLFVDMAWDKVFGLGEGPSIVRRLTALVAAAHSAAKQATKRLVGSPASDPTYWKTSPCALSHFCVSTTPLPLPHRSPGSTAA